MQLAANPLFAAGSAMLSASGPSLMPQNPFAAVGPAMMQSGQNAMVMKQMQRQEEQWKAKQAKDAAMQKWSQDWQARAAAPGVASGGPLPSDPQALARELLGSGIPELQAQGMEALMKQGTEPKRYSVGGSLVDAQGNIVFKGEDSKTTLQKDYEVAKQQGFKGTLLDFDVQRRKSGATNINVGGGIKPPSGYMLGPDGQSVVRIPGMEPTEGQAAAGNYATRMQEAGSRVAEVEKRAGFDPTNLQQNMATQIPVVGNFALSADFQEYQQAKEDWVRAKLRKESGAVIAREEMQKEMETYFPMPGDKPEVIARKREARRIAEQGMAGQAGSAAPDKPSVRRYNPQTGMIE